MEYQNYIADQRNSYNEYTNENTLRLIIEGREYYGYAINISLRKTSMQQFLYSYAISFIALSDKDISSTREDMRGLKTPEELAQDGNLDMKIVTDAVASILERK
jgi:hypothetical protein